MLGDSSRKKRDHQESQYRVGFYFCNLTSNLCNRCYCPARAGETTSRPGLRFFSPLSCW